MSMKYFLSSFSLLALPFVALADPAQQAVTQAHGFVQIFNQVILYPTIGLLAAVALLVFLYGCFEYVVRSGNDQARAQGVKHITWGIVGLVIMFSAFAILSIVTASLGLGDELENARDGNVPVELPDGFGGAGEDPEDSFGGEGEDPLDAFGGEGEG